MTMPAPALVLQIHLLTLVHGMWGEPSHVSRLAEIMVDTHKDESGIELDVLIAETNKESHTYDGIDWGAERIVKEAKDRIAQLEADGSRKVTRFSIVGYSLGGLLARYAVGVLNSQGFFDTITPINFATIATPNVGLLRYPTTLSYLQHLAGPTMLSRTGKHFYAKDDWKEGKPLLEAMSERGGVFYDALAKFKHVTIFANAINDLTVPYVTAAIEHFDPFVASPEKGVEIELDETYAPIIKEYNVSAGQPLPHPKSPTVFTLEWFKGVGTRLPPWLQRPFPYNLVIVALLPILFPLVFTAVLGKFTYNVYHSKRRIKVLEASGKHSRSALTTFVQSLEAGVEDAVVEIYEDDPHDADPLPDASPSNVSTATPSRANTPLLTPRTVTPAALSTQLNGKLAPPSSSSSSKPKISSSRRNLHITYHALSDPHTPAEPTSTNSNQPLLTPAQHRMIDNLNSLPNLQKRRVFLDGMRNSHATIVCRDVKGFEFHKRGEGVLRCLAEGFEM